MIKNQLKNIVNLLEIEIEIKSNPKKDNEITKEFIILAQHYRDRWQSPSEALEYLQKARQLYRNLGIDPTRYRPASEALLRRAIQGKEMPNINAAVDAANFVSLRYLLPLGLYDRSKIKGSVILREGGENEFYTGLGKPKVTLKGKYVLVDEEGPFGNPSADSSRTSIDKNTRQLYMVIFVPVDFQLNENMKEQIISIYSSIGGRIKWVS